MKKPKSIEQIAFGIIDFQHSNFSAKFESRKQQNKALLIEYSGIIVKEITESQDVK